MFIKILEILRIVAVGAAFYFGYSVGYENGYHPDIQLHIMIPVVITAIAGSSGIEGLFFSKQTALAKGFETGSNYQKQSAIALLSFTFVSLLVLVLNWGIRAELTIFFAFIFFFFFSAINHTINAITHKNYKWANINRPFVTLLLIAGMLYPVIEALKNLS